MMRMYHPDLKRDDGSFAVADVVESAYRDVWKARGWLVHEAEELAGVELAKPSVPSAAPMSTAPSSSPQGGVTPPGDSK